MDKNIKDFTALVRTDFDSFQGILGSNGPRIKWLWNLFKNAHLNKKYRTIFRKVR